MNVSSSWNISARLAVVFGGVIAVFSIVAAVTLYTNAKLAEADKWNTHTYKVLGTADNLLRSMINMETGARGFHPLIAAQFCAALADNALLIVGIALLQAQGQPGWLAPMLKFCATLSYVLLAASNRRSSPASAGRRPRPGWLDR